MVLEKSAAQAQKNRSMYIGVWNVRATWYKTRLMMHSRFLLNCSPQFTLPSSLRKNVHVFCQPPFHPKEIPKHLYNYIGKIGSSATKKKKKKQPGKSQQKETTSVGCKKTKRKANKRPGRGPAIAEKYNMELEIRGTSAAKHMSQAVPILSVCYSIGAS